MPYSNIITNITLICIQFHGCGRHWTSLTFSHRPTHGPIHSINKPNARKPNGWIFLELHPSVMFSHDVGNFTRVLFWMSYFAVHGVAFVNIKACGSKVIKPKSNTGAGAQALVRFSGRGRGQPALGCTWTGWVWGHDRRKFKTVGNLPVISEPSVECTAIRRRKTGGCGPKP